MDKEIELKHEIKFWKLQNPIQWLLGGFLVQFFLGKTYWNTIVSDQGFEVTRRWGTPLLIPWEKIECLDLCALNPPPLPEGTIGCWAPNRSIYMIIEDAKNIVGWPWPWGKLDLVASNTLAFALLSESPETKQALEKIATLKNVKLDRIYLPDLF